LGTISAFACRHRETKKNLCRCGVIFNILVERRQNKNEEETRRRKSAGKEAKKNRGIE